MLGERVEGGGYAGAALGERDVTPGAVLVEEARTACWAVAASRRGGPAMGVPSTGLLAVRARPSCCQDAAQRLRTRSAWNASGAMVRQRCQASDQAVPGLRVRVGASALMGRVGAMEVSALGAQSGREVGRLAPTGR